MYVCVDPAAGVECGEPEAAAAAESGRAVQGGGAGEGLPQT